MRTPERRRGLATTWNEGRSIHIGINRVGDAVYRGWLGDLRSAEADARAMRDLGDIMGFAARLLVGEAATRENVRATLEATIERLTDGDVLLVTFAGHMTTLTGIGDDADGWDEAWCLQDGILLDDEFHDLLADVPSGADVLVVTDSCFAAGIPDGGQRTPGPTRPAADVVRRTTSPGVPGVTLGADGSFGAGSSLAATVESAGGVVKARAPDTRLGDLEVGRLVRQGAIPRGRSLPASLRRRISARVVALAAADEGSLAYEGDRHGLFTAALLDAVERYGGAELSYAALMDGIEERLLPVQRPRIGVLGSADASAADARAFGAASDTAARRPAAGASGPHQGTRKFGIVQGGETPQGG